MVDTNKICAGVLHLAAAILFKTSSFPESRGDCSEPRHEYAVTCIPLALQTSTNLVLITVRKGAANTSFHVLLTMGNLDAAVWNQPQMQERMVRRTSIWLTAGITLHDGCPSSFSRFNNCTLQTPIFLALPVARTSCITALRP